MAKTNSGKTLDVWEAGRIWEEFVDEFTKAVRSISGDDGGNGGGSSACMERG